MTNDSVEDREAGLHWVLSWAMDPAVNLRLPILRLRGAVSSPITLYGPEALAVSDVLQRLCDAVRKRED